MRFLLAASSSGIYLACWTRYMVRLAHGEGAFDFWPLMPSGGPLPTFALGLVVFFLGVLWPLSRGRPLVDRIGRLPRTPGEKRSDAWRRAERAAERLGDAFEYLGSFGR